ncbi:MAG: response regulator [Xanthomonadales bacterium]|nr:response regulator [Xanthomonadales bacterium]
MQARPKLAASILAIEDDPNQLELLELAIGALPVEVPVTCADNGMEALHLIQMAAMERFEGQVAMVLLDLRLPRMHGMDVLTRANELGLTGKAPFIVFTSSDSSAERDQALALGARDYLVKPLGFKPLRLLISSLYERWIASNPALSG